MKKQLLSIVLLLAALLTACGPAPSQVPETTLPSTADHQPTSDPTVITTVPSEPTTVPPTEPLHSELYIPDVSVEDVIRYFNEVCLDAEFNYNGDPSKLQKWNAPIYYILHGDYTTEDIKTLSDFTNWLNAIDGFPGIYETTDPSKANLQIHFCDRATLLSLMGDEHADSDGAVTFWYDNDIIYDAIICYCTDLDQQLRNSVILEEIYNGLGPVQDTDLRPDSIIYSGFTQPQELTEMDELILKLLYHPQFQCGMNTEECEAIIRQLYY